jgi:hypothetical protein
VNKPWYMGSKSKLPRGSYLYVQVGHRFYAGEEEVHVEVTTTETQSSPSASMRGYFWPRATRDNWRHNIYQRAKRGMHIPAYLSTKREETTTRRPTGERRVRLTDDLKEVKRFRTWSQAEKACERIKSVYAGFDVTVTIKEANDERSTGTERTDT